MTPLQVLLRRKTLTVLGVNSGTSIDGLDLSLVRIGPSRSSDPNRLRITQMAQRAVSFSGELHDELLHLATDRLIQPERLALVDEAFGEFIGRSCRAFIRRCASQGLKVDCISSHGQTVRHHPHQEIVAGFPVRSTLQIGAPERIAAVSDRIVISHFRQADTALGGEGAPITTSAVYHCLSDRNKSRLIVNIGGIANFFYLPAGTPSAGTLAEDIGPGNLLLDQLTKTLFDKPYDKRGALAVSGTINRRLLKTLTGESFFSFRRSQQLSTGREQYGNKAVRKILKRANALSLDSYSILATVAELVAVKICERLLPMLSADKRLTGVYLTGGGAKNSFLVKRLRAHFSDADSQYRVRSLKALGVGPDSFEATCYAILGWMCLHGVSSGSVANQTRSKKRKACAPILGRIIQPPQTRN